MTQWGAGVSVESVCGHGWAVAWEDDLTVQSPAGTCNERTAAGAGGLD
jgi:hypothetical protein